MTADSRDATSSPAWLASLNVAREALLDMIDGGEECRGHDERISGVIIWIDAAIREMQAVPSETAPMLPELCKALGWQGGTIHQVLAQVRRMDAALREITRGAGPYNRDPLVHADNCIESMKKIATETLAGKWEAE